MKHLIAFRPDAIRSPLFALSLICVAAFEVSTCAVANAQTMLPTDAMEKCDDKMLIESWFDRGFVSAPDNTMFGMLPGGGINTSDCVFLEASMRLFLWLTSRHDNLYVFESPTFYKVTNPDDQGKRKLVQNGDTRILDVNDDSARVFAPSILQLGPSGFPIQDDETRRHAPAHERNRRLENCDERMKRVTPPRCPGEALGAPTPSRGTLTPEQVCEKILISKDKKIVYYSIEINNVYAYFMTGEKKSKFMFDQYPTGRIVPKKSGGGESDIKQIEDFAGKPLKDKNALAIEIKTAWIELSDDDDSSEFITTRAIVQSYKHDCAVRWSAGKWKEARLGLVGMHVVFSAANNPAMIWTTFEHLDNAPSGEYKYCREPDGRSGCTITSYPRERAGTWRFSLNNADSWKNQQLAYLFNGDIYGYNGNNIDSNNILRERLWGTSIPQTATEIINVNKNVADVFRHFNIYDARKNYLLMGSLWGRFSQIGAGPLGSARLANTTMETFFQDLNCISCHQDKKKTVNMSHIFKSLKPLSLQQGWK